MTTRTWYLIHSKPRAEDTARVNLERQGYRAFLPRLRTTVRRQGRYRECVMPLFPRYLFVHLDTEEQDWHPIHSTIGVSHLVRFGNRPAVVADELVDALQQRADAEGIVTAEAFPTFEPGQPVRVIDGPFAGCSAIVQARSGRDRVDILLNLVNQHASARVSPHHLRTNGPA